MKYAVAQSVRCASTCVTGMRHSRWNWNVWKNCDRCESLSQDREHLHSAIHESQYFHIGLIRIYERIDFSFRLLLLAL